MGKLLPHPLVVPINRRRFDVLSYGTATAYPIGISRDRKTVFGSTGDGTTSGTTLYESTDDGVTWTSVATFTPGVVAVRETDDGECLVICRDASFGYVYKSTGWATAHATATWALKLQTPGGYFHPVWSGSHAWSFGDDSLMAGTSKVGVINSYGPQTTGSGSQATKAVFVWLTQDYGATWTQILDLSARYPNIANIHLHSSALDCRVSGSTPRIIVTYGDTEVGTGGTGNMLALTSDDLGTTWADIPSAAEWVNTYRQQPTAIAVLEDCLMLLNDSRGGPWRLPRKAGGKYGTPQQIAVGAGNTGEILISQGAYKANVRGAPLFYAVLTQDTEFSPVIHMSPDGLDFTEVWRDDTIKAATTGPVQVFGPTYNGKVVSRVLQSGQVPWLLRAEFPPPVPVRAGDTLARTEYRLTAGSSTFTAADVATRAVTDAATTSGSPTLTSATAAFTAADVGKTLTATGIPASTVILPTGLTSTSVTMSANATATGSSLSLTIGASYQDVNASNLVLTFTAPPSGRVEVLQTAHPSPGTTTEEAWNVRDVNGDVAGTGVSVAYNSTGFFMTTCRQIVSGLIPGNSYTWKWGFARLSGSGSPVIQVSAVKPITFEVKSL